MHERDPKWKPLLFAVVTTRQNAIPLASELAAFLASGRCRHACGPRYPTARTNFCSALPEGVPRLSARTFREIGQIGHKVIHQNGYPFSSDADDIAAGWAVPHLIGSSFTGDTLSDLI